MSEQRHDAHIGQVDVDVANSMMECLCPNESVFDFRSSATVLDVS